MHVTEFLLHEKAISHLVSKPTVIKLEQNTEIKGHRPTLQTLENAMKC